MSVDVTLISVSLNYMVANAATTNYNGAAYVGYEGQANIERALVKWDMSSIPKSAIFSSAAIDIGTDYDDHPTGEEFQMYQVLQDWSLTTSCWNNYSTGKAWGTAGATGATDISASIGSFIIPGGGNNRTVFINNSIAQTWLGGANYGILCRIPTSTTKTMHLFASSDVKYAGLRLFLTYYTETVSTLFLS
jgi:hypothetical protein